MGMAAAPVIFRELSLRAEAPGYLQKKPRHPAPELLELVRNCYRHHAH